MAKEDPPCPPPLEDLPALPQRDLPVGSVPARRTEPADQALRGRPARRVSGTRLLAPGPRSPLKSLGAGGAGGGGGSSSSSSRSRRRSASCARRAMSARGSGRFSLSPCAGRRKMPQPKPGRAADEGSGGSGGGDKREPARPRMNGENIFTCQAKIYSYVNPSKISTSRPPLQEENSTTPPETKGQTCKLETCQKLEDRVPVGDSTSSVAKSDSQNSKASECESSASPSNPNPEPTETQKLPPAEPEVVPSQKQAPNKGGKKPASRRKGRGKTPPNRKVTDYYPVRRSSRKNKKELQTEEKKRIDELIKSGKEEGMKIDFIDGKGRGVIATRHFNRGEFVVEYHGDLIEITDAKKREAAYAQDPSTGCYMYYFQYLSKTFCVDATKETNRLGRLVNHSKCGNCQTKLHDIGGVPHLILVASRDIKAGEELLYDYGDRSKASLEAHPWLKH